MLKDIKFAWYFLILWFIINVVNACCYLSITNWMAINKFLNYYGYAIFGAYLIRKNIGLKFLSYYWLILYFMGSILTLTITWKLNITSSIPDKTAYGYLTPNVMIASIGIFLALQKTNAPESYT